MIKFGTDGWRAIISDDFTFENVKIAAQAMANFINKDSYAKNKEIIIGYDTRFLSEKYAQLIGCVLAANGIRVLLASKATPTPAVSFTIVNRKLGGGIMVTASHNPAEFNGIKYKAYYGGSADPETIKKIESELYKGRVKFLFFEEACKSLLKMEDVIPDYLEAIRNYVDIGLLKKEKFNLLVDVMYGAGDNYIAGLLEGGRCRVDTIHSQRNPGFGGMRPEPSAENLREMAGLMKKRDYSVGLATDGDVDRLGVITPQGEVISGHKVMALLLKHLVEDKKLTGSVVQTICGTVLINKMCGKYGLKVHETPVGFKYICEIMRKENVLIGGEETGGIGFRGFIPERDGILSGLLILELMACKQKGIVEILNEIENEYGTFVYKRKDITYLDQEKKKAIISKLEKEPPNDIIGKQIREVKADDGIKFVCDDLSWLLVRPSGTEPLVRIYAEAPDEQQSQQMIEFGEKIAFKI
ncbi:MAG: phosphoglucomutase/phosphomannomutase family protein [Candidatus Omnitrophota bacterium]|nr:phosphoglucomutase/phosphomannomutase family protein [Candidatus Omnitrophota bacterium]